MPLTEGKLAAVHHVVSVAGDVPAGLVLAREAPHGHVWHPIDQARRVFDPVPVRVAVDLVQDLPAHGVGPGLGMGEPPLRVLGKPATHVPAVVRVPGGVDDPVGHERGVVVPVAVGDPLHVGRTGRDLEGAFEVAARAEVPGGAVHEAALHAETADACVGPGVADSRSPAGVQGPGSGAADLGESVRRLAAHVLEGAAGEDLRPVAGDAEGPDRVVRARVPGQQRPVGRTEGSEVRPQLAAPYALEATTDVDRLVRRDDGSGLGIDPDRVERRVQLTGRGDVGSHSAA